MKIDDHLKNLKESLEVIEESIEKGLVKRQRNIGFNASAASVDMLEIFLHKKGVIDPGFIVKHEWFNSGKAMKDKFPFEFQNKEGVFSLISSIEEKRTSLCYGKPQKIEAIRGVINDLNRLKDSFREAGLDEI